MYRSRSYRSDAETRSRFGNVARCWLGVAGDVKGDYKPLVFFFADGEPTDNWQAVANQLLKNQHLQLIAIGCGHDTNLDTLRRIIELVIVGTEPNRFVFLHCKCEKTKKFYLIKFIKGGKTGGF